MTVGMKDLVLMFSPATSSEQEWRQPGNDTLIEHHTCVASSWMRRQRTGTWVYLLGEPISTVNTDTEKSHSTLVLSDVSMSIAASRATNWKKKCYILRCVKWRILTFLLLWYITLQKALSFWSIFCVLAENLISDLFECVLLVWSWALPWSSTRHGRSFYPTAFPPWKRD